MALRGFRVFPYILSLLVISEASIGSPDGASAENASSNSQQKLIDDYTLATISTEAKEAIIMDFSTGAILFQKNALSRTAPSSMTKLMLMYVAFQAIQDRKLDLNTTAIVSETAWRMSGSKMFLEAGSEVRLEDLIRGIIVQSGNDACIVLADKLFGSEDVCVQHMNATASKVGMRSSRFKNSHGLTDEGHFSSVYDLAVLARRFISDFPEYYHYFSEKEFTYSDIHQYNRNNLLWQDIGVDGIKTGLTEAGGYGVIVSAIRDGRRIVVVINGCKSARSRTHEARKLLEFRYSQFANHVFADTKGIYGQMKVNLGKKSAVDLVVDGGVYAITVPSHLLNSLQASLSCNEVAAPVKKGQKLATLRFEFKENPALSFEFPLIAAEDVEELNFFIRLWEKAKQTVRSLWPGK
ncbi:MAG: D-alanyl-D-alanine carboxypeptidase [Holosporales bacterium]|jgi:D-alanyl-D-alanine carboxypeptidase (penicillin-binding protein 5/6)|nr:D-alanyl-D-alanine carboxypeptidase [Holosporales bacterium]